MITWEEVDTVIRPKPLVSIITPVFNGEQFLEETLTSIANSTYENLEIIVVDDGSTDGSLAIAHKTLAESGRAHKIFTKPNSGEADSDNFGLSKSSGEYVAFISADDLVHESLVTESVKVLENQRHVVVTYPNWRKIDESGRELGTVEPEDFSRAALYGDMLCLPGPGAVIRRSAFKDGTARRPEYRYISDFRQWLDLALVGDFVKIQKSLASWRLHGHQQTNTASAKAMADELQAVMPEFFASQDLPDSILIYKNQAIATGYYRAAIQSLVSSEVKGTVLLIKSFVTPFSRRRSCRGCRKSRRRSPFTVASIILQSLKLLLKRT